MEVYAYHIQTAIVAVGGMLAILSLILGLERMIRIIMANYLIASIILGIGNVIDLMSNRLLVGEAERWVDGFQSWIGKLLAAGKPTLLLTIYFVLLVFVVNKAHLSIGKIKHEGMRWILTIVFLPCTVISILMSLAMAIYGNQVMDVEGLSSLAEQFIGNDSLYNFIMLTPVWVILPGLVTIIVAALVLRNQDDVIKRKIKDEDDDDAEDNDDE